MSEVHRIGVVGARGHTGSELLGILKQHPGVEVVYAGSRELEGEPVPGFDDLLFGSLGPDDVASLGLDVAVLALPNGVSDPFVDAIGDDTAIVDISADHRLDAAWVYGLPELNREKLAGARRIANPGCYATVTQLIVAPFLDDLAGTPVSFGVSGYSGAGTTPSDKNDPTRLADNLMPYTLVNHVHEREASVHLGRPIRFVPHVHPAFRGLLVTIHLPLADETTAGSAFERLTDAYAGEGLVEVVDRIPELRDGSGLVGVLIGGVAVSDDGTNLVVVGAEDNLLKGAAVQAVQNINLALGHPELAGIDQALR